MDRLGLMVLLGYAAVMCAILAASYGMSMLGEPRSVWFWCDMLGLCQ